MLAALFGAASLVLGLRAQRISNRVIRQQEAWPGFVEALVSALAGGLSTAEALETICSKAPKNLRAGFDDFLAALRSRRLQDSLTILRESFSNPHVDEFVKLLILNESLGGWGLIEVLKKHALIARAVNAANAQARAKRSATLAVAKLGVGAPWVLLALLLSRPESSESFSTSAGITILLAGLAICIGAYRLIVSLGQPQGVVRVYAQS